MHLEEGSLTLPSGMWGGSSTFPSLLLGLLGICCGHGPAQGHLICFKPSCYYNVLLARGGDSQGCASGPCRQVDLFRGWRAP